MARTASMDAARRYTAAFGHDQPISHFHCTPTALEHTSTHMQHGATTVAEPLPLLPPPPCPASHGRGRLWRYSDSLAASMSTCSTLGVASSSSSTLENSALARSPVEVRLPAGLPRECVEDGEVRGAELQREPLHGQRLALNHREAALEELLQLSLLTRLGMQTNHDAHIGSRRHRRARGRERTVGEAAEKKNGDDGQREGGWTMEGVEVKDSIQQGGIQQKRT